MQFKSWVSGQAFDVSTKCSWSIGPDPDERWVRVQFPRSESGELVAPKSLIPGLAIGI